MNAGQGSASGVSSDLFEYLLRLGDDALVVGHRLSEWAAMGPYLEEDLALSNIALDYLGQAQLLFDLASTQDTQRRNADELVFFRDPNEYRNFLICELPVAGDFALTVARSCFFDLYRYELFRALAGSTNAGLAAIAEKALPEVRYHVRHSTSWAIRLGDGTDESHARLNTAWNALFPFLPELFGEDDLECRLGKAEIVIMRPALESTWRAALEPVAEAAKLPFPPKTAGAAAAAPRGWRGEHSEHLAQMLAEMQSLARAYPGAQW